MATGANEFASAVEQVHEASGQRGRAELLRQLLERARSEGELLAMLRLLLPAEDRETVYGMKTRRLMRVMAAAVKKSGDLDAAARLATWTPAPCRSALVKDAVVSMPELAIASAAAPVEEGDETATARLTVQQLIGVCDRLTSAYLHRAEDGFDAADMAQTEILLELLVTRALGFHGWLLLARVLLKRVSLGIGGMELVLAALPPSSLSSSGTLLLSGVYHRQRSLATLARLGHNNLLKKKAAGGDKGGAASGGGGGDDEDDDGEASGGGVRCGTPFRFMTGDALRSPYLFKWIFSREERLRKPIPPVEGRLVIRLSREEEGAPPSRWFVPLNARLRTRMVSLDDTLAATDTSGRRQLAYRQRHMRLLHEFKRAKLINEANAAGLVLHYSMSDEKDGVVVLLLRDVSDAMEGGVELVMGADEEDALLPRPVVCGSMLIIIIRRPPARSRAEPRAEPKAARKAEPKAARKAEPKAARKAEPKAARKAEPKAARKAEPKAARKAEPKAARKAEPKAARKARAQPPPSWSPQAAFRTLPKAQFLCALLQDNHNHATTTTTNHHHHNNNTAIIMAVVEESRTVRQYPEEQRHGEGGGDAAYHKGGTRRMPVRLQVVVAPRPTHASKKKKKGRRKPPKTTGEGGGGFGKATTTGARVLRSAALRSAASSPPPRVLRSAVLRSAVGSSAALRSAVSSSPPRVRNALLSASRSPHRPRTRSQGRSSSLRSQGRSPPPPVAVLPARRKQDNDEDEEDEDEEDEDEEDEDEEDEDEDEDEEEEEEKRKRETAKKREQARMLLRTVDGKRKVSSRVLVHRQAPATEEPPQQEDRRRRTGGGVVVAEQQGGGDEEEEGVIAQVKLDGDRLQAHIWMGTAEEEEVRVKLFTKNGFDASELYSDVSRACAAAMRDAAPCILDGELVVVDQRGVPLPWDNEKWRYNNNNHNNNKSGAGHHSSSNPQQEEDETMRIRMVEYEEGEQAGGTSWEEASDGLLGAALTFLPASSSLEGVKESSLLLLARGYRTRAVRTEGAYLRLVLFDVLLCDGEDLARRGYAERWRRLDTRIRALIPPEEKTVGVIDGTCRIRTASALVELVREGVAGKLEGYVLKDPDAPYAFDRTPSVQKVKLSGPDINTAVLGVGFSLPTNPRRWGLATGLLLLHKKRKEEQDDDDDDDDDGRMVEYYCRTEVLEGDRPHHAFELVYEQMRTRVAVKAILLAASKKTGEVAQADRPPGFRVFVVVVVVAEDNDDPRVEVRWQNTGDDGGGADGTVRVPKRTLQAGDLQWLISPWECPFSLSLRGDLWALEDLAPRHPVGRPEPAGVAWDSRETVRRKFEEATDVRLCVERHALRRLRRLRALPPTRQRLEEVGRTALGWNGLLLSSATDGGGELWPQLPPGAFVTISALSDVIVRTGQALAPELLSASTSAMRRLSPEERKAMADLPSHSQWLPIDRLITRRRLRQKKKASAQEEEEEGDLVAVVAGIMGHKHDGAHYQRRAQELRKAVLESAAGHHVVIPCDFRERAHAVAAAHTAGVMGGHVPLLLSSQQQQESHQHHDHPEGDEEEEEDGSPT